MSTTGSRAQVSLDHLLLDPNNFRFRDQDKWSRIEEQDFQRPAVQRKAERLIEGKGGDGVADLLASLRANGWLEVDQIQVRPWQEGDHKFVVVEGNRRVAALRRLRRAFEEDGEDLGKLSTVFFDRVPVSVQRQEDRLHHLVHMGLVHITGKQHWSPLSQSLAIRELVEEHGLGERDVCNRLAISIYELRLSMRALYLCDAYQASDWGDQFGVDRYTLLRETVRNPSVKGWIGWDDATYSAENSVNRDRLFALISVISDELEVEDGKATIVVGREPALRSRDHVRRLGKLVEAGDERAIRNLEESRDLTAAEQSSDELGRDRVRNAVALLDDQANQLFQSVGYLDQTHAEQLKKSIQKLGGLWMAAGRDPAELRKVLKGQESDDGSLVESASAPPDYPPPHNRHLSEVTAHRYRSLQNLKLDGLRRINILAGLNNSGKTSWLEAVRLLVCQADTGAFLDILRRRGRMLALDTTWAAEQLLPEGYVGGIRKRDLAAVSVRLRATTEHARETSHPGYLGSLSINAQLASLSQTGTTHLYSKSPGRTLDHQGNLQLGPCVHSSPFSSQDPAVLSALYDAAVGQGHDQEIVGTLRDLLDPGIRDIKLSRTAPPRFRVSRSNSPPPDGMDLGMYGDGLQRLFQIGLLFAHAEHGFVLIDELENGVHAGLLPALAKMIHDFAMRFDTQVFLATHSKEAVDAFVGEPNLARDVRGFSLGLVEEARMVRGIDGEQLSRLVDLIDADLRVLR